MTFLLPGSKLNTTTLEARSGECTSLVIYNPHIFDLSIEVDEEPPVPKIYELPENQLPYDKLVRMHEFKRPHGSKTERKFIKEYLTDTLHDKLRIDKFGNRYVRISDAPIMWSCHLDTVHASKGQQKIGFDGDEMGVAATEPSNCLGADDTAGVWLMLEMIAKNRPGLYIFHRGEEVGCLGSKYIAKKEQKLLEGIKFAIALDRKGTTDVITRQRGTRTCSDEFAKSLAEELGMGYKPDSTGIYTDTAEYTDLIGECTNISVGYRNAHQRVERLDLVHIFLLRDALLALDWEKLVAKREPGEKETYTNYSNHGHSHYYGGEGGEPGYSHNGYYNRSNRKDEGGRWENGHWIVDRTTTGTTSPAGKSWWEIQKEKDQAAIDRRAATLAKGGENPYNKGQAFGDDETVDDEDDDKHSDGPYDYDRMVALVKSNPEAVADIMEQFGYGPRQLAQEILEAVGICNH